MSSEEKEISFLNNYFIYKKVRNVDIDLVVVGEPLEDEKNVEEEMKKLDDDVRMELYHNLKRINIDEEKALLTLAFDQRTAFYKERSL